MVASVRRVGNKYQWKAFGDGFDESGVCDDQVSAQRQAEDALLRIEEKEQEAYRARYKEENRCYVEIKSPPRPICYLTTQGLPVYYF